VIMFHYLHFVLASECDLMDPSGPYSHSLIFSNIHHPLDAYTPTNNRFPVSNACGQYGTSYQDIVCGTGKDAGRECPLDTDQSISAMTRPSDVR
jgi:hypothetical protein